jgi:hypothetical protein
MYYRYVDTPGIGITSSLGFSPTGPIGRLALGSEGKLVEQARQRQEQLRRGRFTQRCKDNRPTFPFAQRLQGVATFSWQPCCWPPFSAASSDAIQHPGSSNLESGDERIQKSRLSEQSQGGFEVYRLR